MGPSLIVGTSPEKLGLGLTVKAGPEVAAITVLVGTFPIFYKSSRLYCN